MDLEDLKRRWIEEGDWFSISNLFKQLDPSFIMKYGYCLAWGMITETYQLDEDELERYCIFWLHNAWTNVCHYQKLSEQFMRNHYRDLDWEMVSHYQHLSQEFMLDYRDVIYWPVASCYQIIVPEVCEELKDCIYWEYLNLENYDERWVIEHVDRIGWSNLICKKQFSEQLIREYKDEMDWGELSSYQNMSEDFVREFENDITFNYLLVNYNSHFSKSFIEKYINKIGRLTWKSQEREIINKYGQEFYDKYKQHFKLA